MMDCAKNFRLEKPQIPRHIALWVTIYNKFEPPSYVLKNNTVVVKKTA